MKRLVYAPYPLPAPVAYKVELGLTDGPSVGVLKKPAARAIQGIQVRLSPEISKDTGLEEITIPVANAQFELSEKLSRIKVNAVYVLGDTFLKERG